MDELNHRVRNTLAIVMAIANQTLRHASSAAQFRSDFEARVTALSAAHNLLTASNWEGASLRDIVESVLKPYAITTASRYRLDGEPIRVGPKYAVSLLMAFHELATNAAKYGALSNDEGHVEVTWALTAPPKAPALAIEWREIGGPPVKPRRRRGFGSRLIDGLSAETDGNVDLKFERERRGLQPSEVPLPPNGEGSRRASLIISRGKISASLVMNGSSVRSSRSGVTAMRLSVSAERSVPSRPLWRTPRSNAIQ